MFASLNSQESICVLWEIISVPPGTNFCTAGINFCIVGYNLCTVGINLCTVGVSFCIVGINVCAVTLVPTKIGTQVGTKSDMPELKLELNQIGRERPGGTKSDRPELKLDRPELSVLFLLDRPEPWLERNVPTLLFFSHVL